MRLGWMEWVADLRGRCWFPGARS